MTLHRLSRVASWIAALVVASPATAYPGGTPTFQTDAAPYCAGCHSSRSAEALSGFGERAEKETSEKKHIALILNGEKGYEALSEADRTLLSEQIRALDAASTVTITAPAAVDPGATFEVTVKLTGGAGPAVGVALVDRAHRWLARPIASVGFTVVGAPRIVGGDGQPQTGWLEKRPADAGRNLSYVNVTGLESNSAGGTWASAEVVFTLRAPAIAGSYPLSAAYFYGTEKSTLLGYTTNAVGSKVVRGGFTGGSGRILFAPVQQIQVGAAPPPAEPTPGTPGQPIILE